MTHPFLDNEVSRTALKAVNGCWDCHVGVRDSRKTVLTLCRQHMPSFKHWRDTVMARWRSKGLDPVAITEYASPWRRAHDLIELWSFPVHVVVAVSAMDQDGSHDQKDVALIIDRTQRDLYCLMDAAGGIGALSSWGPSAMLVTALAEACADDWQVAQAFDTLWGNAASRNVFDGEWMTATEQAGGALPNIVDWMRRSLDRDKLAEGWVRVFDRWLVNGVKGLTPQDPRVREREARLQEERQKFHDLLGRL